MYNKTVLNNGIRLITSNMPSTHSVCISVFLAVGSRYETDAEAGTCHFIEHMCFKGTQKRPTTKEIAETIEGVGGMFNGGTAKEFTTFWCKVARPHFPVALNLLVDILRSSKFDPAEVERERGVILEELKDSIDSPQDRVGLLIGELLWPEQALGRDIIGTKKSISALTRNKMLRYMGRCYGADSTVVAVAGALDNGDMMRQIEDAFSGWQRVSPRPYAPADDRQREPRVRVEHRKTEQAHICLGVKGVSLDSPDRYYLDLLNVVLGGGMSSRLNLELREKRGLVYDIDSYVEYYLDSGALTVYAGVDPKSANDAVAAIIEEIARLKEEVPAAEVTKVKELVKGRLLLGMEDTKNVATWAGRQETLTGQVRTVDDVVSIIDSVEAKDLMRVARKLFVTRKLSLAVVGPVRSEERLSELLQL